MMENWIKRCLLLVVAVYGVISHDLKFDYQIIEGKARFTETIETNLEKNTVKYYTPAHNDVLESYKFQDYQEGLQMTCLPSERQCRLRNIDKQEATADAGAVTEAFVHRWNEGINTISDTDVRVVREVYYVDITEEFLDMDSLGENLRTFYDGFRFPLFLERKIQDIEKMYNNSTNDGERVKRAFRTSSLDCNGSEPIREYGIDSGKSCNYLVLCSVDDFQVLDGNPRMYTCKNTHITSPLAYVCIICPQDREKFRTRQGMEDFECGKMGGAFGRQTRETHT